MGWHCIVQYTSLCFNRTLRKYKQVSQQSNTQLHTEYRLLVHISYGSNTCVPWYYLRIQCIVSLHKLQYILPMHIFELEAVFDFENTTLRRMKRSSVEGFCNAFLLSVLLRCEHRSIVLIQTATETRAKACSSNRFYFFIMNNTGAYNHL